MSTIPLPALQIKQPEDPLANYARIQQIKSAMQNQQLQQGQMQLQNQQIQEGQFTLQERQNMIKLAPDYVQKDDSGKVTGYDQQGYFNGLMQTGVRPSTIYGLQNQYSEMVKNTAAAGSAQIDLQNKKNDGAYQLLEGVRSVAQQKDADPQAVNSAYQQALPRLQKLGIDTTQFPQQYPGDQGLTRFEANLGVHRQMLSDAKEVVATQAEVAKAALDNANAVLAGNKASIIAQYRQNPNLLSSQIDAIFAPNTPQNTRYKFGVQTALQTGDVDAAKAWITQASQEKSGLEKEAFVQGQESLRQNLNRQAMMSNELQKHGLSEIDRMFTDPARGYTQFLAQANATKGAIADAKDGSEFSASLAPLMTVLGVNSFAGVHRINPAEYQAAGPQVGSIYRRINAVLDKAGSGAIPADTMKEMNGLIDGLISVKHQSLLGAAQMVAKNAGLDTSKTAVMTSTGGIDSLSNVAGKSVQQGRGQGGKVLSVQQIQQAAKDHGVSVDEATRQARAQGYTIQ